MESCPVQARMLGSFTLCRGDSSVEVPARARKVALLLAYLILSRERSVPWEELAALLWPGEEASPALFNSLKALIHRARGILDGVGAGKALLNRDGCCRWDPDCPVSVDAEEFSRLCRAEGEDEAALALRLQALALYRGGFLPGAGEPWAAEQAASLHALWLETLSDVLPRLAAAERWADLEALARQGQALEPCREALCRRRMEALMNLGRCREAVEDYEAFQARLLERTGALPSDGLRELCRTAREGADGPAFSPATLPDRLREPPTEGALLCGFDFFRVLCFSLTRMAQRQDAPLFAALLTLAPPEGGSLPRHSLDRAMDNLQGVLLGLLRRGDAVSRCSASQFVLLLPQAGFDDARKVCRRACRAFRRQFPHAPVTLDFCVVPLTDAPLNTPSA